MFKKYNFILIIIFGLSVVNAQESSSFTMDQAVEYAYTKQLEVRLSQNKIADAKQQIKELRSTGLPQVNGTIDYNHFIKIPTSVVPAKFFNPMAPEDELAELQFGTKNNLTASATLSTLIFDGSFLVALQAAKSSVNYANANLEKTQQNIKSNVKKAYLPPLLLAENILTVQKNISSLQKMHHEMSEMYKAGFIEQLDVDRISLSIDNLESTLSDLEKNKTLSLNALKFQMGFPLSQELELTDIISLEELNKSSLLESELDYNNLVDIKIFKELKTLNKLNIKRYKAGYLPSLTGFVSYQRVIQGANLFKDSHSSPTSIAGLAMKVPIFDSFRKKHQIQRAKLALEAIEIQEELVKTGIDFSVQTAKNNYRNTKEKILDRQKNVDLAKRIYATTQTKYREGVGSSIEMIQAEQSLYQSQQNYFTSLYDFMKAKIDLEIALGL